MQADALKAPQLEAESNGHQRPAHNHEGKLDQQHDVESAIRGGERIAFMDGMVPLVQRCAAR